MALGIGLIGTGFMGKTHALAWRNAQAVMGNLPYIRLELLCDQPADRAAAAARQFGFSRSCEDWRQLVEDKRVDIVSITTPNGHHHDMAIAALEAGKHVWCEKPMALTLDQARAMVVAASKAKGCTMLGYNYTRNPAYTHACRLVADGAIGEVVHFRGVFDEDYQADGDLPWTWRSKMSQAGLGSLGDLGCHLVSLMLPLTGPVESLIADSQIIHTMRPLPEGGHAEVENEDTSTAILRFRSGAQGSISTSRSAWGRKNWLSFEVHGKKGSLVFDQERMNELQLFQKGDAGLRNILTSPEHPPFGLFVPAAGHQLGFVDLKIIEAADFLRRIAGQNAPGPDFAQGLAIEILIHAIAEAASSGERHYL